MHGRECYPHIIDTTLREGMQAPGVRFGPDESAEIARSLVRLGVDMVECGHPRVGEEEARRVVAVVAACGTVPVLAHARAKLDDIVCVKATGAKWVGIFFGINEISRASRFKSTNTLIGTIKESIAFAKQLGLRVRFTVEDASRTNVDDLVDAYQLALEAGADRICFADTVGLLCPWEVEDVVGQLCRRLAYPELEVHFHDDRGMATANALSAIRAGARWVSSSINGIGERCGITDTLSLMANLHALEWRAMPSGTLMQHTSLLVQAHSRLMVDRWRPVVGRNAFTHVAKLHRDAVQHDERAYSWINPALLGRESSIEPSILPVSLNELLNAPKVVSSTELRHHRHGPGERYLLLDERVVSDARQYCIVRKIPELMEYGPGHVDRHRHCVDSIFLFIGGGENLSGLSVEVSLGEEIFTVNSPTSVFIPSGVMHSYRVIGGAGFFINHVLSGDYNSSLLYTADVPSSVADSAVTLPFRAFT
ncbi:LeuA family protein [Pseudomonas sp. RtIB026]|uniref:LeuA family protein n=1 Tax=Pseudomonas sp. RtIB026 TaxID=2749999 RepID=UPI00194184F2|nr:LeuA family protein [Pseudomonas sp. RtIB026]